MRSDILLRSPGCEHSRRREIDPPDEESKLQSIVESVEYIGSPEHKTYPSFAGPMSPRPDASKCDSKFKDKQELITSWLRKAIEIGSVGSKFSGDYPRYVWYLSHEENKVYEARLVNKGRGTYKGYPLESDEWPEGIEDIYE